MPLARHLTPDSNKNTQVPRTVNTHTELTGGPAYPDCRRRPPPGRSVTDSQNGWGLRLMQSAMSIYFPFLQAILARNSESRRIHLPRRSVRLDAPVRIPRQMYVQSSPASSTVLLHGPAGARPNLPRTRNWLAISTRKKPAVARGWRAPVAAP